MIHYLLQTKPFSKKFKERWGGVMFDWLEMHDCWTSKDNPVVERGIIIPAKNKFEANFPAEYFTILNYPEEFLQRHTIGGISSSKYYLYFVSKMMKESGKFAEKEYNNIRVGLGSNVCDSNGFVVYDRYKHKILAERTLKYPNLEGIKIEYVEDELHKKSIFFS